MSHGYDDETIEIVNALLPELSAVLVDLREHVSDENGLPVCGAKDFEIDLLVHAALASDCDDCRTKIGVALVNEKQWDNTVVGQRSEPVYTPQPMLNADEICESARKNRDGR